MWQKIYKHLQGLGVKVYSVGQYPGETKEPYVVLKEEGSSPYYGLSSNIQYFRLYCYVPATQYSKLGPYVAQVEEAMKPLRHEVIATGNRTPAFPDDSNKSVMISIQYQNNQRRIKYAKT